MWVVLRWDTATYRKTFKSRWNQNKKKKILGGKCSIKLKIVANEKHPAIPNEWKQLFNNPAFPRQNSQTHIFLYVWQHVFFSLLRGSHTMSPLSKKKKKKKKSEQDTTVQELNNQKVPIILLSNLLLGKGDCKCRFNHFQFTHIYICLLSQTHPFQISTHTTTDCCTHKCTHGCTHTHTHIHTHTHQVPDHCTTNNWQLKSSQAETIHKKMRRCNRCECYNTTTYTHNSHCSQTKRYGDQYAIHTMHFHMWTQTSRVLSSNNWESYASIHRDNHHLINVMSLRSLCWACLLRKKSSWGNGTSWHTYNTNN